MSFFGQQSVDAFSVALSQPLATIEVYTRPINVVIVGYAVGSYSHGETPRAFLEESLVVCCAIGRCGFWRAVEDQHGVLVRYPDRAVSARECIAAGL